MMLKRKINFDRLKFILDNLNKNVEVVGYVYSPSYKIEVKIGVICYEILLKTLKFLNKNKEFYEIVGFLHKKQIKIVEFYENDKI